MKNTRQQLTGLSSMTLRDLIERVNEKGIRKEDIVYLGKEQDTYVLLYYKEIVEG